MRDNQGLQDELNEIAKGFPKAAGSLPPSGYFDKLPDDILNRWKQQKSDTIIRRIGWKRILSIAAVLSAVLIGSIILFHLPHSNTAPISSAEAYMYIQDNIGDFEILIESEMIPDGLTDWDVPNEAILEYLMEEQTEDNIEDLF
ncbi:MAG: hypothetical protein M3R25_06960 [Bacteroidota bacterium]|nr:hypothetical protein [Bacteroidota bacterium]